LIEALHIAGTGLEAQRRHVEVLADNLANLATPAFRRGRVGFAELVQVKSDATQQSAGDAPAGRDVAVGRGRGVAVDSVWRSHEPAALRETGSAWDLAIEGEGFVEVHADDGRRLYGRAGRLSVGSDGWLQTATGHRLAADIRVPDDMREIAIDVQGRVTLRAGSRLSEQEVGRIELIQFASPERLRPAGPGLYEAVDASGPPVTARAGESGAGVFRQGHLEGSNVRLVEEFSSLVLAQRAYEASLKVFQTADEMLGLVNNLRR